MPSRRLILEYFLMVIIPLLGLVGVLELGKGLTPPPSLAGAWEVEVHLPANAPCSLNLAPRRQEITVSQSGQQLLVRVQSGAQEVLLGKIEGLRFIAAANEKSRLRMSARIEDPQGDPSMEGVFEALGQPGCAPVAFRAARKGASRGHSPRGSH